MVYSEQSGSDRRDSSNDPLDILERELGNNDDAMRHIAALRQIRSDTQGESDILEQQTAKQPERLPSISKQLAEEAYKELAKTRKTSVPIRNLTYAGNIGSALEATKTRLKEERNGPFILIASEGDEVGWLFPDPTRNYTEDFSVILGSLNPELRRENWDQIKINVQPGLVEKTDEGNWIYKEKY